MPKVKHGEYTGGWYDDRNEKRKELYHSDPEYREQANKAARDGYRKTAGTADPFDPRQNLDQLEGFGSLRLLRDGDPTEPVLTFSKAEVAKVFNRPSKQIQQWANDHRIPGTLHKARIEKRRNWVDVYLYEEVKAMVEALGPHLSELIYFRKDHVDAITAVHDAISEVRS